jgi:hypothetical protein
MVKRAVVISAAMAALWFAPGARAQRSATTTLVLRVAPEAHLNPPQVTLHFRVSADGASDVASQTETIAAWVRALPGQRIRLTALPGALTGPAGVVPGSAIRWSGAPARATSGGQSATCTSGSFNGAAAQDLASGWRSSGTLACAVTFSLADPRGLPPGAYMAVVNLSLRAE